MEDLTVMVVDPGARGHVLSSQYERSPKVKRIIVAQGNDNNFVSYKRQKEVITEKRCKMNDPDSILALAKEYKAKGCEPDLIEVAQDDALAAGDVDVLAKNGLRAFGPSSAAARIESSKIFSRQFMARHGIPSPGWKSFDDPEKAKGFVQYLYLHDPDQVFYVKADGLCAGKGAIRAENIGEAWDAIDSMAGFGESGKRFLLESGMSGEELSVYAISDGEHFYVSKSAQDNKRVYDDDKGLNTGGMGAISPAMVTDGIMDEVTEIMISRMIGGMNKEKNPYKGIVYLGGMKTPGGPKVVEYNARWGDPEVQVVLPGIETDYFDVVSYAIDGRLHELEIKEDGKTRVCVVVASKGYPEDYKAVKGKEVRGLDEVMALPGITVYGAAIRVDDGKMYADGGRLFSIVGEGNDIIKARDCAYDAAQRIRHYDREGIFHFRTDIGMRDVRRLRPV